MLKEKYKKLKKKKGITSLEAVIGTLIFLFLFCVTCDLLMMSNRYSALTDTGKELARTISVQGGALEEKPPGYASNYYTITDLEELINKNMSAAGFKNGEWAVYIQYTKVYDDTEHKSKDENSTQKLIWCGGSTLSHQPTMKIDYLSNFTIKIAASYDWKFMHSFIPNRTTTLTVSMPGTSEWKYDYDKWESET